jgi:hypothetical protein
MTDFDYKKYSLENLEKWMSDALLSSEATPKEIYDVIRGVVHEEYHYFKHQTGRCYELLALLGGTNNLQEQVKAQGDVWDKEDVGAILAEREYYEGVNQDKILSCDKDDPSPECQKSWNDFWEEVDEKHSREYNLREAEYYNKRAELDAEVEAIKAAGGYEWTPPVEGKKSKYYYEYDRNDPNRKNPFKDRVVKWQLPVQQVKNWVLPPGAKPGSNVDYILEEDYVVNLPDDLLDAANLKEGDTVEWVDQGDGSYLLKKV